MGLLDVLQVQAYIATSRATPVVLRHRHVCKPTVLLKTTLRVYVALHRVQLIQDYIVTSQATPVILDHRVLLPMVLLQTTKRANVALHRVLQIQAYIATSRWINVV